MAKYVCKRCGKEFEYAGMGRPNYCYDCKHRVTQCVICGKDILQKDPNHDTKTCSRACAGKYRKISGISKKVASKSLATKKERYGNGSGAKYKPRICKLCGGEFIPAGSKQIYCKKPHYGPCPACGKPTLIKELDRGTPRACSEECRVALITQTHRSIDHSEALAKGRKTNLERYGSEYYSSTQEWRDKVMETSMQNWGYTIPLAHPDIKAKVQQTNLEKYGYANPAQSPEIIKQIADTLQERYGGCGMASDTIRNKIYTTNEERYGNKHPAKTPQCKEKSIRTTQERYGADNYNQTKEGLQNIVKDPSKIDEFWEFRNSPEQYIANHYSEKPYVDEVAAQVGVNETTIYDVLIRKNCKDLINRSRTSMIEREVYAFLTELVPKEQILWGDKRTITPLELDFYVPDYKFAIECNPSFTHNSSVPSFKDTEPKPTVYHRNKTQKAEEVGIFLLHIFGYEWNAKQEIIKSMIRNALRKCERRIYARNTEVRLVDAKTATAFLNSNHRQGNASARVRLGLFEKNTDELVSLMTFSKPRPTIGKKIDTDEKAFELVRFCSLLNTSVVGGASKLFKYFLKEYHPDRVISFSDRAHTKGTLYETLGFKEIRRSTDPGYVWADPLTEEYKTRVVCQKHNLPNVFKDITKEDMKTKSEADIMIEHGYVKVFDSGTITWEYTK